MKNSSIIALLAVLCGGIMPSTSFAAEPMTAQALQKMCDSRYDIDVGLCAGYVTAIAETLMQQSNSSMPICLSPAISPQTLIIHIQAAWHSSPPQQQDLAQASVESILRNRFRCP